MSKSRILGILFMVVLSIGFAGIVLADPTGPNGTITPISSSRYTADSGKTTNAIAGNITEFNLNANSVTQTWQGYFGNITGRIILGSVNNDTFYDWSLTNPQGEIYATRLSTTPTWSSVACANSGNITAEDTALGVNQSRDADSVNRTFLNTTTFSTFYVGSVEINQGTQDCFATHMYNGTGPQSTYFPEVLLTDGSGEIIYTGLIESDSIGFDDRSHDFQMIVGEDGHDGDTSPSVYYFYLELE